jgi:hypothetical protein
MRVFVVQSFWGSQSGDIYGVYATEDLAFRAINEYEEKIMGPFSTMLRVMTDLRVVEQEIKS